MAAAVKVAVVAMVVVATVTEVCGSVKKTGLLAGFFRLTQPYPRADWREMYLDTAKKGGEWLAGVNDVRKKPANSCKLTGLVKSPDCVIQHSVSLRMSSSRSTPSAYNSSPKKGESLTFVLGHRSLHWPESFSSNDSTVDALAKGALTNRKDHCCCSWFELLAGTCHTGDAHQWPVEKSQAVPGAVRQQWVHCTAQETV